MILKILLFLVLTVSLFYVVYMIYRWYSLIKETKMIKDSSSNIFNHLGIDKIDIFEGGDNPKN